MGDLSVTHAYDGQDPFPPADDLEIRSMGDAGRKGMTGGRAELTCMFLPSLRVFLDDSAKLPGTDPARDPLLPCASHSFTSRPVAQGYGARWWPPGWVSLAVVIAGSVAVLRARSDLAHFLSKDGRSPKGSQRREIIRRKDYFYRGKIRRPGRTHSFPRIHPSCVRWVGERRCGSNDDFCYNHN